MLNDLQDILHEIPELAGATIVLPLGGGITNRNYRVLVGNDAYALRIAGDNTAQLGIDRDSEYACAAIAAAVGIGAEVVAYLPARRALLTRFVEGRVLSPMDATCNDILARAARTLARLHEAPAFPKEFSAFAIIEEYHRIAQAHEVPLPGSVRKILEGLDDLRGSVASTAVSCPCHNDLLPANLIDDGTNLRIIDWEYAGMGDRFFDLGNFAENHRLSAAQESEFLRNYAGAVQAEDLRRLRVMRKVSALRETMWGFAQAGISRLEFDFPGYAQQNLERFLQADSD
ncbi:MAG TPA: phosphotransferase [Pirellulales bacterium]